MNKKSILNQLFCIFLVTVMIGSSIHPVQATESFNVNEFVATDTQITGSTTLKEPLYVSVDGTIKPITVKSDGTFHITFAHAIDHRAAYFYKKSGQFYELIHRAHASLFYSEFPPPTFYGVKDGKMSLQTHPSFEIVAVYGGETFVGKGLVEIPLKQATEVKAYTRNGSNERSLTKTYKTGDSFNLPFDTIPLVSGQQEIRGETLPHQELKLSIGNQTYHSYSERDGQFRINANLPFKKFIEGFSAKLELIHPDQSTLDEKTIVVPPLEISNATPYHTMIHSFAIEGMTYPNASIIYEKQTFEADGTGYFHIPFVSNHLSKKELIYAKDDKVYAKQQVRQSVEVNQFPLTILTEPSTLSGKFEGKTEPGATLLLRADHGEYSVTSDDTGMFSTTLPLFERGTYAIFLKTDTSEQYLNKNVSIREKRPLSEPHITFKDELMYVDASKTTPIATEAEIQITKPDGELDVAQVGLSDGKAIISMAYNNEYRVRVKSEEQFSGYVEGVHKQLKAPTMKRFFEGETVIEGTTDPFATIHFYMKRHIHDGTGQLMKQTADETGAFSFQLPSKLDKFQYQLIVGNRDGTNSTTHIITPKDMTTPILSIDGNQKLRKISEEATTIRVTTDDVIQELDVDYLIDGTWTTGSTEISLWKTAFTIAPAKPNVTFKEARIKQIRINVTNPHGLRTSIILEVKDLIPPPLQLDRLLYGEQTISGTTEPFKKVTHGRSGQMDTQIADANGRFTFKLSYPISKYSSNLYPISVSDENGNKAVKYPDAIEYRIQDIRVNPDGTKVWLANENRRMNYMNYELIVNGTNVGLNDSNTLIELAEPHSYPLEIEVRLKNEDGTIKYALKKRLTKASTLTTPKRLYAESGKSTITGQLDPHVSYDVYDATGKRIKTNVAGADGSFASAVPRRFVANELLRIVAKDPFGQTKSMSFRVTDKTPPTPPTIHELVAPLKTVSGKTEAAATVQITYRGKTYTTKADSKGVYRLAVSNWQAGQTVSVTASDSAKNRSSATTAKILNAFKTVSVAPVRTTSATVTGKVDAAAYVRVYSGTRQLGKTVRGSSKATFSVAIPKQKKGTVLTVRVSRSGYGTVERKVTVN